MLEDDVGPRNLDAARRRQLVLDVRGVLRRGQPRRDAPVEPVVAPVSPRELDEQLGGGRLRDHDPTELGSAEHVIPVGVRVRNRGRRCGALVRERVEDLARVGPRRSRVQHERAPVADDGAHRRDGPAAPGGIQYTCSLIFVSPLIRLAAVAVLGGLLAELLRRPP